MHYDLLESFLLKFCEIITLPYMDRCGANKLINKANATQVEICTNWNLWLLKLHDNSRVANWCIM